MADNLKPYDPNKGFISFRLNPDAIKEALIEQVPYNRTLRYIYNNPKQWRTEVDKAREDYWNSLNGPYFEDIMGYYR